MSLARLLTALAALAGAGAGSAMACAICLSAVSVTSGERLDAADRAVLATPDGAGLRVVAAVKGAEAVGATIPAAALLPEPQAPAAGRALLLGHNPLADTWTSLGATDPASAGWLARVAATSGADRLALAAAPRGPRPAGRGDRP